MFYSVPHDKLLAYVRKCIEDNGDVSFINNAGVSVDNFLALLQFYLNVTFITFDDKPYLQRQGICIGSYVAPVLCDIFLADVDRTLDNILTGGKVLKIFRYVDDFLVLLVKRVPSTHPNHSLDCQQGGFTSTRASVNISNDTNCEVELSGCDAVFSIFKEHGRGLRFTAEVPTENCLQFLDLKLQWNFEHFCWFYHPRVKKGILPFDSAHSKIVKRGIASLCLESALSKSCPHHMRTSFNHQISRLQAAGFPSSVITTVAESLLQKLKSGTQRDGAAWDTSGSKLHVMPYVHKLSHNLKKVAARHGVSLVFSAPEKLANLCPRICNGKRRGCQKKHQKAFVKCSTGVVYSIPLSCGKVYIGQTERCLNDRLREHAQKIKKKEDKYAHLVAHAAACGCEPRFTDTQVLGRSVKLSARVSLEAYLIEKNKDRCVSEPSVVLHQKEISFLETSCCC